MRIPKFIRKEPVAWISLLLSLILGVLASPLYIDWYFGPKVIAEVYISKNQGRNAAWKIVVENQGRKSAKNVLINYEVDFFTARGDLKGYYSGEEPLFRIIRRIDFSVEPRQIKIPSLPPGVRQEFIYLEEVVDSNAWKKRELLIAQGDKSVVGYPRVLIVTSDEGIGKIIHVHKESS